MFVSVVWYYIGCYVVWLGKCVVIFINNDEVYCIVFVFCVVGGEVVVVVDVWNKILDVVVESVLVVGIVLFVGVVVVGIKGCFGLKLVIVRMVDG